MRTVLILFMALHGLVYLLYFGQALGLFELEAGLGWPQGSWALSRLGVEGSAGTLVAVGCALAAAGFLAAAAAAWFRASWWPAVGIAVAAFSSLLFLLAWNGRPHNLDGQGGIGLLINAVLVAAVVRGPLAP